MDKILNMEDEKKERQKRILRSLNLDDDRHVRAAGESCSWNPGAWCGVEMKKYRPGEMHEIFYKKPDSLQGEDSEAGKHPKEEMQMKKRETEEEQSRKTGRLAIEGQNVKRSQREEGPVWKSHSFQCAVLSAAALLLAAMAIFQEAGSRTRTAASGQNRIVTARSSEADPLLETQLSDSVSSLRTTDIDGGSLILVNKDHGLPEDYTVDLHWLNNGREAVAEEMYDALSTMLTDGSTEGREFVVASGYRSYERQQELLEEDIQASMEKYGLTWQEAYEKESQETMPEGHSEHETGLAVDLVALDYQMLDGAQEYTEENQWLQEHCQEYGFILRYPRGKEDVTGISYESWHFRYVGAEAAKEIMERGITLEEYLEEIG